jgi:hypothetical protein
MTNFFEFSPSDGNHNERRYYTRTQRAPSRLQLLITDYIFSESNNHQVYFSIVISASTCTIMLIPAFMSDAKVTPLLQTGNAVFACVTSPNARYFLRSHECVMTLAWVPRRTGACFLSQTISLTETAARRFCPQRGESNVLGA